ncbi:MAG: M23 family metallopeptidase [bacterium]
MPTKKGITIFLVPHTRKKSLSLHLEGWQVTVAIIVFAVAVLLFVFGVVAGGRSVKLMAENRSLRHRNEILLHERMKIAQLERELSETSKLRQWMESLITTESKSEGERIQSANAGGMGFLSILDKPFEYRLMPELKEEAESRRRKLDFIPRGLPVKGAVTSTFGEMGGKFLSPHTGVDIAAPEGTVVMSTAAGIVLSVEKDYQLGLVVTIDHMNDYKTRYGHLKNAAVSPGDWIEKGGRIGIVGESGHARGLHVHYEILLDGELIDPMEDKPTAKETANNG